MSDEHARKIETWRGRRKAASDEGWESDWRAEMVTLLIDDPDGRDGTEEAIWLLSEASEPTWEEESVLADLLLSRYRSGRSGPADLDHAVARLRNALRRCDRDRHQQTFELGMALAERADTLTSEGADRADGRAPGDADRAEAIACLERAAALCAPEEPIRPVILYWLAVILVERSQDRPCLDRAIGLLEEVLSLDSLEEAGQAEVEARLGELLARRIIHHGGDPATADRAISLLEVVHETLLEAAARRDLAMTIGRLYDIRVGSSCGPAPDRDTAAEWIRRAVAENVPQGAAQCHADLGMLLLRRCLPEDTPGDLTQLDFASAAALGATTRDQGADGTLTEAALHLRRAAELTGDPRIRGMASLVTMLSARSIDEIRNTAREIRDAAEAMPEEDRAEAVAKAIFLEAETDPRTATVEQLDMRIEKLRRAIVLPHRHALRSTAVARLGEALTQRGELPGGAAACTESSELLREALREMPRGHPLRGATALALARAVLSTRWRVPSRAELDGLVACLPADESDPAHPLAEDAEIRAARGAAYGMRAIYSSGRHDFEHALGLLNGAAEAIPSTHLHRGWLLFIAGAVLTSRFSVDGDLQYLDAALSTYAEIQQGIDKGFYIVDEAALRRARGITLLLRGMRDQSAERLKQGITDLERTLSTAPADSPDREVIEVTLEAARLLAGGTMDRSVIDKMMKVASGASDELIQGKDVIMDLAAGLSRLATGRAPMGTKRVVDQLKDVPGHYPWTFGHEVLAEELRAKGDVAGAVRAGLRAQRARLTEVMVQTAVGRGLDASREAGDYALRTAQLAISAGLAAEVVEALELGRGMALHSATAAGLSRLLSAAGEESLAQEWAARTTSASPDAPPVIRIPDDLRRRVVLALAHADEAGLLAPPGIDAIAAALREGGFDALIYLLPHTEEGPGRALLVHADGKVNDAGLPGLDPGAGSRVDAYRVALMDLLGLLKQRGVDVRGAKRRWRIALLDLCAWAWREAMERLVEKVGRPGRIPRVVLVPWGRLGLVPWHAAGLPAEGRYACQRVAVTYAASARQLCAALSGDPAPPGAAPLLVSDPAGDRLRWGRWECDDIARLSYPAAERLGRWRGGSPLAVEGAATADAVLARLPGGAEPASLLHLGCHAVSAPSAAESYILLQGEGGRLSVDRILERAGHYEPGGTRPLIVLSACTGDLTENDHDEALTLASALLAVGAAGVVASRWAIDDDPRTALMMVMFHRFLSEAPTAPSEALRRAQAWMLDPEREIPDTISSELRLLATERNLADPAIWAAFTAQGR